MKREDTLKVVLDTGRMTRTDVPVTIKAVKRKSAPVKVGRETVDRTSTYIRLQLPSGDFLDCRIEGSHGDSALNEVLVKDPYFKPFFDATQVGPEPLT